MDRISINEEYLRKMKMPRQEMNSDIDKARDVIYGEYDTIKTGFHMVDQTFGGFRRGEMILLASEYSFWSRYWIFDIMIHNAIDNDIPVLYISLYERPFAITRKLIGHMCGVAYQDYKSIDKKSIEAAVEKIKNAPIIIQRHDPIDMDGVLEVLDDPELDKPKLIILDRIGYSTISEEERSKIYKDLNELAYITKACVLILSDMSLDTQLRKDSQILLSDLPLENRMMDYIISTQFEMGAYDSPKMTYRIFDLNCGMSDAETLGYNLKTTKYFKLPSC